MNFPQPFYRWRPHPWHGLDTGRNPPLDIHAYIEITPFDTVKYEIDKKTGYLRVDRPQRTSSQPPTLYGFVPRTFCGDRVGALMPNATRGDGDPLDICVFSERPISRSEVLLNARVIGGLQMLDHGEADDKIVAVLENDSLWGEAEDITDLPPSLAERLRHYFLTYKLLPGEEAEISIDKIYGRDHAAKVVEASVLDYQDEFGG
ncbi:inorganic pyrophosphatase [Wenzhouxiangella marina]|uniref:inorganic diphosphatase n=1 Tax=Wenzhouxiangella marina TaxID=1579979 RepID=A0A0K0XWN6_9GAMM|nr:inorganic pyrophosphatase [Wenzhouxiangella marina]AKS42093.1 Inorganic pyrophosphatase [Wenzhouxiangella marina]MBB6086137.1 inorganic pyrophosphatase [Wenzhouxiangella marina]